jgi:DNA invertase Pin-like site-specific DNA recombinase
MKHFCSILRVSKRIAMKLVKKNPEGRRGRPVRPVPIETIRNLYQQGYSFRAISRSTGLGYGTVRRAFHGLAPLGADLQEGKTEAAKQE